MSTDHLTRLQQVLRDEAGALTALADRLDDAFAQAVTWMHECRGRVVTCGVGKSGHIAAKASATLSSTGTPSVFMHAAEAVHGDLGMVTAQDLVLVYTYSGETDELVRLFPSFRQIGARTITMTGRRQSSAAHLADLVLDVNVEREVCPHNLAPTTSTTAMLAVSDALAVAVMEARNFRPEDFAKFHPAGALGRRLTLRVADTMRTGDDLAIVGETTPLLEAMGVITRAGSGGACVVDQAGRLTGFVSDGDLRRFFLSGKDARTAATKDAMSPSPSTIEQDMLAFEALEVFQNHPRKIGEMPVVYHERPIGLLVLKDLLRAGLV